MFLNFLLCGLLCAVRCELVRQFHFVNMNLAWAEARQFCREHYTEMAIISSSEQVNQLLRPTSYSGDAWIGLYYADVNYDHWESGYPVNGQCPYIYTNGFWFSDECTGSHFFICYNDAGVKDFIYVMSVSTWAMAKHHCRESYTDLALIENLDEAMQAYSLYSAASQTAYPWIGRDAKTWRWCDGSQLQFTNWLRGRPLDDQSSNCIVEDQDHLWRNVSCDQKLPFFCYKDVSPMKKTLVKISFHSNLDMTYPSNYGMVLQQIEERLRKQREQTVNAAWKSPPKKHEEKTDSVNVACPLSLK